MSRWGIISWSGIIFLYGILTMYLYPTVKDSSADMLGYINSLPEAMKAAFGYEGIDFTSLTFTPEAFATLEFLVIWPLLIGIYGVFSSVGIAREMESGTLDLLLAQPVRRYKVITAKFAVFAFSAILIATVSVLGLAAGAAIINETVDITSLTMVIFEAFLLVLAIGCVTLLFAAIFLQPRRALLFGGLFMAFSYILNFMIPILPDSFEWIRNLSIFYHFQPNDIISSGALNGTAVTVYSTLAITCFAAALYIFQRRDLTA
ncbi:hypothetical protein ES708_28102 [subsurface metagenome]